MTPGIERPAMKSGLPRARAFTLLETMLAAAMGALIVASCVGVFAAMERHELRLRARASQVMALSRLHTVMRRACTTFVMAEQTRTPLASNLAGRTTPRPTAATPGASAAPAAPEAGNDPNGGDADKPVAKPSSTLADLTERTKAMRDAYEKSLPPRFMLAPSAETPEARMSRPVEATHAPGPVQRFEMVLTRHPLPTATWTDPNREAGLVAAARSASRSDRDDPKTRGGPATNTLPTGEKDLVRPSEADEPEDTRFPDSGGSSVRGAFELRPSPEVPGGLAAPSGDRPRSWTLYWQPLTPLPSSRSESERSTPPPIAQPDGPAVEIATDLEYVHWQVFRERERRSEHRGWNYTQLPAYIEMEVKTIDGVWANWMFEVDWSTGVESEALNPNAGESGAEKTGADAVPPTAGKTPQVPKNVPLRPAR